MPTPEALAREKIDEQLIASGWFIQNYKALNLGAGKGSPSVKSRSRPALVTNCFWWIGIGSNRVTALMDDFLRKLRVIMQSIDSRSR